MVLTRESPVSRWLKQSNGFWFVLYATAMAFGLYTCVYAFRKTFSVATFEGVYFAGISYKVWLVTFQVVGYALSKFVGIKVISELKSTSRFRSILLMVGIAGISWLLFAIVPRPYNIVFLFTNGFPLGLIWGMIFGYLEGRRYTEVLGAGLSVVLFFLLDLQNRQVVILCSNECVRHMDAIRHLLRFFSSFGGLLGSLTPNPPSPLDECFAPTTADGCG